MKSEEHLQHGRSEIIAAKDAAADEEVVQLLDNLNRGVDLVAPGHRPVQPQSIVQIKVQIDAVVDMSSETEVIERLERAKEHYGAVHEAVQTGSSSGL